MKDITAETCVTFPHTCGDINKVPDLTNRFCPFEALDAIESVSQDRLTILKQVHALRAYITGMEK